MALPFEGSASNWIGVLGFTVIDVFAAALILECIHPGSLPEACPTWKPLRPLGIISYGFMSIKIFRTTSTWTLRIESLLTGVPSSFGLPFAITNAQIAAHYDPLSEGVSAFLARYKMND